MQYYFSLVSFVCWAVVHVISILHATNGRFPCPTWMHFTLDLSVMAFPLILHICRVLITSQVLMCAVTCAGLCEIIPMLFMVSFFWIWLMSWAPFHQNSFLVIEMWQKFNFALIQKENHSPQVFVHGTIDVISWHMQNLEVVTYPIIWLQWNEIVIEFRLQT